MNNNSNNDVLQFPSGISLRFVEVINVNETSLYKYEFSITQEDETINYDLFSETDFYSNVIDKEKLSEYNIDKNMIYSVEEIVAMAVVIVIALRRW